MIMFEKIIPLETFITTPLKPHNFVLEPTFWNFFSEKCNFFENQLGNNIEHHQFPILPNPVVQLVPLCPRITDFPNLFRQKELVSVIPLKNFCRKNA